MGQRPSDKKPSPSSPKEKKEEGALRRRLEEALSEAELSRVLTCALLTLDEDGYEQLFARLGLETAAALALVLNPPATSPRSKVPSAPTASKGKLEQEWGRLWAQWAAVIKETGKKKGKYICQEAHWEPSYIDTTAISTDLDAIASQLRPLLSRVMAEGVAPEFRFAQALDEMDAGLYAGLPDWIEPGGGEPCYLGTEATSCLLEWEWALAQREGRDAAAFLDEIRDLELRLENVALDSEAIKTFVFGLSDEHLRGVLASMTRQRSLARWADAFRQAYGAWAEIVRDLSQRWNRELFVETSRANIAQDWTLALPLVQSAVKRKAFAEATALIDEALRSRLRRERAPRWEPRAELLVRLVHGGHAHLGHDHTNLVTLLQLWPALAGERRGARSSRSRRSARAPARRPS
ncbi:MAG: hypothetical protein MUF34_37850 [Polyangiaceae bacterium]|nr:hypothetical protein [Polyangiaceae bacterium]